MTLPEGQYGYYAPGSTHRRLCEVQNGNVYFLDDNRILKVSAYPGRFVLLVDAPLDWQPTRYEADAPWEVSEEIREIGKIIAESKNDTPAGHCHQ